MRMNSLFWLCSAGSLALIAGSALAQNANDGFDPNADRSVYAIALQPDGKILIGGDFNSVSGTPNSKIARLNIDGSLDATFNPGADSYVLSVAVQPDGKI